MHLTAGNILQDQGTSTQDTANSDNNLDMFFPGDMYDGSLTGRCIRWCVICIAKKVRAYKHETAPTRGGQVSAYRMQQSMIFKQYPNGISRDGWNILGGYNADSRLHIMLGIYHETGALPRRTQAVR